MRCITALSLLFITTTACQQSKLPPKDETHIAISATPSTLDPRFATDAYGSRLSKLLFNSLVKVGPNLNIIPDGAESWEVKNKRYIFQLKPLVFSNGRPLNKEDLNFSLQEYTKPTSPFKSSLNIIDSWKAFDKNGKLFLEILVKKKVANFLTSGLSAISLLPAKEMKENPEEFKKTLMGTGSYQLIEQSNSQLVFAPTKNGEPKATNSKLVFKIIRDDFTRFQKILSQEIDLLQSELPLAKVKNFKDKKDFKTYKYPGLSFSYLLLNLKDPTLKNKLVRQAIALAVPRDEIMKYKLYGFAKLATSMLTPENPYFNKTLEPIKYDPKKAQELLKQVPNEQRSLNFKVSNNPQVISVAKVIAQKLREVGFRINLKSYEWGTYYHDIKNSNFHLASMRWIGVIDPDIYRLTHHSQETPPGRNRGHYNNKNLDQLLEKSLVELDKKKRKKLFNQVQSLVLQELSIIPLWYNQQVAIARSQVKNYSPPANGDYSTFYKMSKE